MKMNNNLRFLTFSEVWLLLILDTWEYFTFNIYLRSVKKVLQQIQQIIGLT